MKDLPHSYILCKNVVSLSLSIRQNIIDPCQIGFQAKSRTRDHIFSLKTLINKYVHNTPKGKIYACFVIRH